MAGVGGHDKFVILLDAVGGDGHGDQPVNAQDDSQNSQNHQPRGGKGRNGAGVQFPGGEGIAHGGGAALAVIQKTAQQPVQEHRLDHHQPLHDEGGKELIDPVLPPQNGGQIQRCPVQETCQGDGGGHMNEPQSPPGGVGQKIQALGLLTNQRGPHASGGDGRTQEAQHCDGMMDQCPGIQSGGGADAAAQDLFRDCGGVGGIQEKQQGG